MAKIKATRPILYQNRLYEPGEELPQHDPAIVRAWLAAGSAKEVGADLMRGASTPKAAATSGDKAKAQGKRSPAKGAAGK